MVRAHREDGELKRWTLVGLGGLPSDHFPSCRGAGSYFGFPPEDADALLGVEEGQDSEGQVEVLDRGGTLVAVLSPGGISKYGFSHGGLPLGRGGSLFGQESPWPSGRYLCFRGDCRWCGRD